MNDLDDVPDLPTLLHQAIDACTDTSLLDFLYKMLLIEQSPR
jgi:hypothetical protein